MPRGPRLDAPGVLHHVMARGIVRALQKFRCGMEAAISMLKRKFSLGRVLARGSPATAIWTGFAVFAYNLWQQR